MDKKTKERVIVALKKERENYPSDARHATALGLATSVYSAIKNGAVEKQLSESNWIVLARRLGVELQKRMPWQVAETPTYVFITEQLTRCQQSSISAILCDLPNIGKTFTAREYVRTHANAIYIDCSQSKTKSKLIKAIAKEFGLSVSGRYADIYDDLALYLSSIERPLIVLDEAGDLQYEAFLELKALWNATERSCAWYMMGADGLRAKINRSIENQKVGYTEMLSRYGDVYSRVTPEDGRERDRFLRGQAGMVAQANVAKGTDVRAIVNLAGGSLRRVYTEIEKIVSQ